MAILKVGLGAGFMMAGILCIAHKVHGDLPGGTWMILYGVIFGIGAGLLATAKGESDV